MPVFDQPAIKQRLHVGGRRIARPEHQEMRMLERRDEPCTESRLVRRTHAINKTGRVLD